MLSRALCAIAVGLPSCASLRQAVNPASIAQVAPQPVIPLAVPSRTMKGGKGEADVAYPPDFAVTLKSDGTIVFPQHTVGRIKGPTLLVGGDAVLSASADGTVKGAALKHPYKFDADGGLLDDQGRGVRISPDGRVRGVGGEWRYKSVFAWASDGGGAWDQSAWRTLEIVALVMIENMLPAAIRSGDARSAATGDGGSKDKGLNISIPPPSEWFK